MLHSWVRSPAALPGAGPGGAPSELHFAFANFRLADLRLAKIQMPERAVRNIISDDALLSVCAVQAPAAPLRCSRYQDQSKRTPMASKQDGRVVETATEARQAEPGPSVLALLSMSLGLAVIILAVVWFVFFRT